MKRIKARIHVCLLLQGSLLTACEDDAPAEPPKSRVQAVLASPGAAASANATAQPAAASKPTEKVRPALCAGQLSAPGQTFEPKQHPQQKQDPAGRTLAENPVPSNGRWTWINLWAAWCLPCKQELPLILSWQRELNADLNVSFVSLDDDERQLSAFLAEQPTSGLKQSYWLPDGERRDAWLAALGLGDEPELPLQVLLDPRGNIRCTIRGAVELSDRASLETLLSTR